MKDSKWVKGTQVKVRKEGGPGKAKFDRQSWRETGTRRVALVKKEGSKQVKIAKVWARLGGK